jgi:hypothetical protein
MAQHPGSDASQREVSTYMREQAEQGWIFGWEPLNWQDQMAHLGEMMADAIDVQAFLAANPERAAEIRAAIAADPEWDEVDPDEDPRWLEELLRRIEFDSYTLNQLMTKYNHPSYLFSREDAIQAEIGYAIWKGGGPFNVFEQVGWYIPDGEKVARLTSSF